MPPLLKHQQLAQAILDHVQSGAYPEAEDIASAELRVSALPDVSKYIEQAHADLKAQVQCQSKDAAPDVDGWISQAQQLRVDIERSQDDARGIVDVAHHGNGLELGVTDAASKVRLLEDEVAFSHSLEATLGRLRAVGDQLDRIQQAILNDSLSDAVDLLGNVDFRTTTVLSSSNAKVAEVFSNKSTELRQEVAERLRQYWDSYIDVERGAMSITVRRQPKQSVPFDLESTVGAMRKLGTLDQVLLPLFKDIETLIALPRLQVRPEGLVSSFEVEDDVIFSTQPSADLSAEALFADLHLLITFLRTTLPKSIAGPLAEQLMPHLISRLITTWLASAVPEDLDGLKDFHKTLELARNFGEALNAMNWPGKAPLDEWSNSIPHIWFRKRQESSLGQVRSLLSEDFEATEVVERIETQVLSQDDEVFAGSGGGDDWNASWSDEGEESLIQTTLPADSSSNDNEDDVSAWGFDDEKGNDGAVVEKHKPTDEDEDGAEAWGWGDEVEQDSPVQTKPSPVAKEKTPAVKMNGISKAAKPAEREVTLRETYTITSLPREILDIIAKVISDSKTLESPAYIDFPIAKSASSLLSIPGLALAMFRAGSPSAYVIQVSGNMYLYNDCLWLAEQLRSLPAKISTSAGSDFQGRSPYNLNLSNQVSALESHGKRAYAKEMESQRTIITDMLDGAEGFGHCTEHPFNQECETAIASVTDRLRQIHREWRGVLSQSALLQSLGSLLSTICSKIIIDIEDMSDISEPESQQLANYCSRIGSLEDLFKQQRNETSESPNGEEVTLTAVYTTKWLKFQYLAQILESSLADIKFLWSEGELGLEFETEEVVDLIVALFADSPHRRAGIGEIRAARRA